MTTTEPSVFEALEPIGLDELDKTAALRNRVDRKYVVATDRLSALVRELASDCKILDVGGDREFTYRNVYFDSPQLDSYRAHVQRRRRRYKVRTREYVESGIRMIEVKLKGRRGETLKRRRELTADAARDTETAASFLSEILHAEYGEVDDRLLVPILGVDYRRSALVLPAAEQRLTVDLELTCVSRAGASARLRPGWAIVETKSPRGAMGPADRALRCVGARPISPLSKYLLGVALTREVRGSNDFRRTLSRYFEPNKIVIP